jgi:hypothetical protein
MMKASLLTALLLFSAFVAFAQEKEVRFQKELKLNVSFLMTESGYTMGNLAPVFILENKLGNRHEFELNRLDFSEKIEEESDRYGNAYEDTDSKYSIGLRYQYTHAFPTGKKVSPFIGGAFLTIWTMRNFETTGSTQYPNRTILNTNAFEFVPGARWQITERVGLDISTIFYVLTNELLFDRVENPSLPIRAQQNGQSKFYSRPFDFFLSRVGLVVKL